MTKFTYGGNPGNLEELRAEMQAVEDYRKELIRLEELITGDLRTRLNTLITFEEIATFAKQSGRSSGCVVRLWNGLQNYFDLRASESNGLRLGLLSHAELLRWRGIRPPFRHYSNVGEKTYSLLVAFLAAHHLKPGDTPPDWTNPDDEKA